jgi:iron complex outermembrane receptor protein
MNRNQIAVALGLVSVSIAAPMSFASVLEETVVTAQKREQSLQDVGIAVTAYSGDQLDTLGFTSSSDIALMTPGVHVGASVGGQSQQFTIRGVTQNDFSDHTEAPIATYIDETYILSPQGQKFAMFDLERVEVLKGPQGTLFGRNATGGLVHFVSRKPTDEVEGYLELEYGDYDKVKVQGALGGSLSDTVRGRVSGLYTSHDAYLDNDYDPTSAEAFNPAPELLATGAGDDLGEETNTALRAHLEFDLGESAQLLLSANWAEAEMSSSPYQSQPTFAVLSFEGNQIGAEHVAPDQTDLHYLEDGTPVNVPGPRPVPGGDATGYIDPDGPRLGSTSSDFAYDDLNSVDAWGFTANLNWDLGWTSLVAITDFKDIEKYIGMDVDAAPMNQLAFFASAEISQFTQEIRLQGETDSLSWIGGFYYMSGDYDNANGFKVLTNGPLLLPPATFVGDYPAEVDQEVENYSLFGQVDFNLSETLTLTTGVRVIQEKKDFDYALVYRTPPASPKQWATGALVGDFGSLAGLPFPTVHSDSSSDTLWTGKIQLDWTPSEDLLIYGGINRGVKAGGFNAPIDFGGGQLTPGFSYDYDEEVLYSYEGGFKATLFGGTTRLNGSLYYYDYQDYQAFVFAGVSGVVVNADSSVIGGELELVTSPLDGLDIMLGVGVYDAEVEDVSVSPGVIKDVEPSFAPSVTASSLVRYAWPAFGGELAVQGSASYTGDFYYSLRNFNSTKLDSYTLVNTRVSYTSENEEWVLAAFVNNATDEEYAVTGFDISLFCGCSEIATGQPRWWGVSLRRNF